MSAHAFKYHAHPSDISKKPRLRIQHVSSYSKIGGSLLLAILIANHRRHDRSVHPFVVLHSANLLKHIQISEYGYMVKYVQQPDENRPQDWRIRQTGILHQFNASTKHSIVIMLNPHPKSVIEKASFRRIEAAKTLRDCVDFHSWLDTTVFDLHMTDWRQYNWQNETTLQILVSGKQRYPWFCALIQIRQRMLLHVGRVKRAFSAQSYLRTPPSLRTLLCHSKPSLVPSSLRLKA